MGDTVQTRSAEFKYFQVGQEIYAIFFVQFHDFLVMQHVGDSLRTILALMYEGVA